VGISTVDVAIADIATVADTPQSASYHTGEGFPSTCRTTPDTPPAPSEAIKCDRKVLKPMMAPEVKPMRLELVNSYSAGKKRQLWL
jgi:hypothetical protein